MKGRLKKSTSSLLSYLWDIFCLSSLVGIWPRFIEPQLLITTQLPFSIPNLPESLKGFRILQMSDLHLGAHTSACFLKRLKNKISKLKPDLIAFTGDFICFSHLQDAHRLKEFLSALTAPYGCYAVLGNHDYDKWVSINSHGEYSLTHSSETSLVKGFKRLFKHIKIKSNPFVESQKVAFHEELMKTLRQTSFQILHNKTHILEVKNAKLNICGLGEYMLNYCNPEEAYKDYDLQYPGIILLHNPDGVSLLKNYPGNIILCGHTHGGQVNLPFLWKKFTLLEDMKLKKGLVKKKKQFVYINRGLGSAFPFRWFSPPELLLLTLE